MGGGLIRSRLGGLSGGRIDVELTNKRRRLRDQSYSGCRLDSFPLILLAVICATRMTAWPAANQKAKVCNRSKQGCNAAVQTLHDYPLSECRALLVGFYILFFVLPVRWVLTTRDESKLLRNLRPKFISAMVPLADVPLKSTRACGRDGRCQSTELIDSGVDLVGRQFASYPTF